MDASANVLRPDASAEQSFQPPLPHCVRVKNCEYRSAVAEIVKELQLEKGLDDEQLGEVLGCSEGTVANARNARGNLDPVTMLNLAACYGGQHRIRRLLALVNGGPGNSETTTEKRKRLIRELAALEDV